MYILGHWAMTGRSGCVSRDAMTEHMPFLLLPDIARCHDAGYDTLFAAPRAAGDIARRIYRSHLLGDWFVHFGPDRDRIKRGWAYRRMRPFARRYREFFAAADRLGLRAGGPIADSPRGFSHTMAEYSIDTHLAESAAASLPLEELQRAMRHVSLDDIRGHLAALGVTDHSRDLATDVARYLARVEHATHVRELAFRAGAAKFGLIDGAESIRFIQQFIMEGMSELPGAEIDDVVDRGAAFIRANL